MFHVKHYKKIIGAQSSTKTNYNYMSHNHRLHTSHVNVSRETLATIQKHKTTPATTQQTQSNKATTQYIKQITRTNVSRETFTTAFLTKA